MEKIRMDGFKNYGKGGINWRKVAWSIAIGLLFGFLTAIMTNFGETSWAVFFIIAYLEYKMK